MPKTHYENLKVTENAPVSVIKVAYKALCQTYHPDKFEGSPEEAHRIMKIINKAYAVLIDPDQRQAHDTWIRKKEAEAINQKHQVHFNDISSVILQKLNSAQTSITVAMAWLTDPKLFDALIQAAKRGVFVRIAILDDKINRKISRDKLTAANGLCYWIPETGASKGSLHHKFCVIDSHLVINGSYNWTYRASRADENITVVDNIKQAAEFIQEFETLLQKYGHITPRTKAHSDSKLEEKAKFDDAHEAFSQQRQSAWEYQAKAEQQKQSKQHEYTSPFRGARSNTNKSAWEDLLEKPSTAGWFWWTGMIVLVIWFTSGQKNQNTQPLKITTTPSQPTYVQRTTPSITKVEVPVIQEEPAYIKAAKEQYALDNKRVQIEAQLRLETQAQNEAKVRYEAQEKVQAKARMDALAAQTQAQLKAAKAQLRLETLAQNEAKARYETQEKVRVQTRLEASVVQDQVQAELKAQAKAAADKLGIILPDGGIVFYVDSSGLHGLEAKAADVANLLDWADAIDAVKEYGSGWRLPTSEELNMLYQKKAVVGGFVADNYWSSNKSANRTVWSQNFYDGVSHYQPMNYELRVRAVRFF